MKFFRLLPITFALCSTLVLAQEPASKPRPAQSGVPPGKRTLELRSHQVERMNRMAQQAEAAEKKGISPERLFQMQQEKLPEHQRASAVQSNKPIAYAPRPQK